MAKETATSLFLGTDHQFILHVKNEAETASVDITGWALSYMIKRHKSDADGAALVTKTTAAGITIAGTFNSNPAVNLQRATVTLADTDTATLADGVAYHEWKRTDDGFETILAYGQQTLVQGVHR